ncbi:MAG: benzoyl-CoA-dihydrodiol lyase, partial [Rhodospirillales bacterium]|nr:benzoyl-CoA-dihydrodiol lyase [Rhodospirillales bacterium]
RDWKLVDQLVPRSKLADAAHERAEALAGRSHRPVGGEGVKLTPLVRKIDGDTITYDNVTVDIDRTARVATIIVAAPGSAPPVDAASIHAEGVAFWPLAMARELDDAILHLRFNEKEIGTWVFQTTGDADMVEAADKALIDNADDWLVREIIFFLKRVFKRIDVTSRSLIARIEPGSCFTGTLLELVLASDRSFMLDGAFEGDNRPPATVRPTAMNFGPMPMSNGLTRLETRFLDEADKIDAIRAESGNDLDAQTAEELGLVTFIPDDIDWEDEVRVAIEERASFSPDALTGMEASLRFAGPETMETKIFGRLTAWQNWIFQRPNAVGEEGALKLFGTGKQAKYDMKRV